MFVSRRGWIFLVGSGAVAAVSMISRSEVKVAGPIEYGQTSEPLHYLGRPEYQAFEFNARPGERIEVTVSAKTGQWQAYLADSDYRSLAGGKEHFLATIPEKLAAGTYYILIKEANRRPGFFRLNLERPSAAR